MSKIANDRLNTVWHRMLYPYGNSGCQRVNTDRGRRALQPAADCTADNVTLSSSFVQQSSAPASAVEAAAAAVVTP